MATKICSRFFAAQFVEMNILVTGGAGYIGTLLVPRLLACGHRVCLYDIFKFGIQPVLHFATHPNLEIVRADVRNAAAVKQAVAKSDAILHLAAIVGFPACSANPSDAKSTNVDGVANIVSAASSEQIIVFASTGSVYGKVEGVCDENSPISPLTLYGSSKRKGEEIMMEKNATSLRFATVFGVSPRLRLDLLVNDFVYQAIHSRQIILYEGYFRRTFLHASDAADAFIWALENNADKRGQIFNIGAEEMNYTKKDIALMIKKKQEYYLHEADIGKDQDLRDYAVSYKKSRALGYEVKIGVDAGIEELIRVIRNIDIPDQWRNN